MASKVTLSLPEETLARARAEAERAGMTLSAWMDQAARRHAQRDAGRRYQQWLDAHPDVQADAEAFSAFAAAARGGAGWGSELGEPA